MTDDVQETAPIPAANESEPKDGKAFRMGSLGRHSLIYAVGMVLTKAVAFLMLPVYTRLLTPADYGVLQLVMMFLEVLSIFAGSRIAYGIFHFYYKAADEDAKRRVLSTAVMLLAVTFAATSALTFALAPTIAQAIFGEGGNYITYIRLAAVGIAFESLITVPNALFQLQQQSIRFVGFSLLRLCLQLSLNLLLLIQFNMGVAGVLLSSVITNVLVGGFLAVRLLFVVGRSFDFTAARAFLRFGLPLVAMQAATFIFTFGDRYFLNKAGDTTAVGLYGLAYQFGFLVGTIGYMPLEMVWDPQRFAVAKRADRDLIYSRVFKYMNVALITAAVGLSLFVGDVLRVISAPAFHGAAVFVPVIVGAYIFQAWGTFFNIGIMITERTHFYTIANWAAAAVAVIGYVLLIPKYLAWGAALTVVASLGTRFWLTHVFSQRLWRINYEWSPVLRLLLIAVVFVTASALAPPLVGAGSVLLHTILFGLYALLVWRMILADADRHAVNGALQRARALLT
ncbi:MAG TPA: oligosaccharide flippase family protein [Longimicrobiales bacterium]|nr:oligosaccharide flippase family protein [Longimicrobiales bacterium]